MKKFYTLFLSALVCIGGNLFAQSLEILSAESEVVGSPDDFVLQSHAKLKNISSSSVSVKAKRVEVDVKDGTINYFCWTSCYSPMVSESPEALSFDPGQIRVDFVADYEPSGVEGTSIIRYVFFNEADPSDSVGYTANYMAAPIGVGEMATWVVRDAYPNPARDVVVFEYQAASAGTVKVELFDMLGNVRKAMQLNVNASKAELNVSDLEPGVYIYTLKLNGESTITKKLVVSRN